MYFCVKRQRGSDKIRVSPHHERIRRGEDLRVFASGREPGDGCPAGGHHGESPRRELQVGTTFCYESGA